MKSHPDSPFSPFPVRLFPMRTLTAILCLNLAVLLGSGEVRGSDLPVCEGSPKEIRAAADVPKWDDCQGTITTANGNKYAGEWKDDKQNGQGTLTYADGAR